MAFEIKNIEGEDIQRRFADIEREDFHKESFTVPTPLGMVKAKQWFFDGIKIMFSESTFQKPAVLDWRGDTEIITMHFNLQGKCSIQQNEMSSAFILMGNEHNIFYSREAEGKMEVEDMDMKSFLIQISKKSFFEIAKDGNDALKRFADNVAAGNSTALSEKNLSIDLALHDCIKAILNCNYSDSLQRMFFFSKTVEILVLQAESFNKSMIKKDLYLKTDYDKERILFARDYLTRNMECPPTLTELSRIAGFNEFKLKKGFKETFNYTAFEYLSKIRLEKAKADLLERKKSITEIAFELGYSSLAHFSAAFKKKYGIPPSKVV